MNAAQALLPLTRNKQQRAHHVSRARRALRAAALA